MKHSKIVIALLYCILVFEVLSIIYKNNVISTFNTRNTTDTALKDELIIALFIDNITKDSDTFYDNYFPDGLGYINYEYKIKNMKKQGEPVNIYITFEGTPIVGPHIPVGDDEITYRVNPSGNITLESFTHKKSYEIPSRLQIHMIKPYPEMNH